MTALVKQRFTLRGERKGLAPSPAWAGLLLLVLGCAGRNVVAGEEKTKSEQLQEALPAWCRQTCEFMAACAASPGDRECQTSCQEQMSRYALGTEECADLGQHFVACVDSLTCDELQSSAGSRCQATETEQARCPHPGTSGDPSRGLDPPMSSAGSTSGGAYSTGGTASTGGGGAIGGDSGAGASAIAGAGAGPEVSCAMSSGTGGSAYGSDSFTCEETRAYCSDGHAYGWICARGSQMLAGCSCFVDGQVTGGFAPGVGDCPQLQLVNAGCGWELAR